MAISQHLPPEKHKEIYARLTTPTHTKISHFSSHKKIDGYFENRDVPDFMGSDRLLKIDSLYGTIQLGYNPTKGQSFIFANIKTSIYDTAASLYQRQLKEYQMKKGLKPGTQNLAYTSKGRGSSAVMLYKMDNMPWSSRTIMPYFRSINMEALQKTMPFLDHAPEYSNRNYLAQQQRLLQDELAKKLADENYDEMAGIRSKQVAFSARQNQVNAIIYRKNTQQHLFFRRLNMVLDIQKHEMFQYYRNRRLGGSRAAQDSTADETNNNNKNSEGTDE